MLVNLPRLSRPPSSLFTLAVFLSSPLPNVIRVHMPFGFFVVEAKRSNLLDQVPQAVCEIYARGKFLE